MYRSLQKDDSQNFISILPPQPYRPILFFSFLLTNITQQRYHLRSFQKNTKKEFRYTILILRNSAWSVVTDDEERVYRNIRRMTLGTALYRIDQNLSVKIEQKSIPAAGNFHNDYIIESRMFLCVELSE